jgi:sialidase-1
MNHPMNPNQHHSGKVGKTTTAFSNGYLWSCVRRVAMRRLMAVVVAVAALGMTALRAADGPTTVPPSKEEQTKQAPFMNFTMRGNLMRSFGTFTKGGEARVAFMGGSVTYGSWRQGVMDYLKERFPNTKFDFINAAVGGTGADLGAFRLLSDVFGHGKVDLFFLEFAVNGGGIQPMEGIVRQSKRLNPDIDIVMMYFANQDYMGNVKANSVPGLVRQHEKVAEHYGIPALSLYKEVGERIQAAKLTSWEEFSGDVVHPNAKGNAIYLECIVDFLRQAWADPQMKAAEPAKALPGMLDPTCFENGRFIEVESAKVKSGFAVKKGWSTTEKTVNFGGPMDVLEATQPGSELSFEFKGTAVGIYAIIGFDAGTLEYAIDKAPVQTKDQFDGWCEIAHRPFFTLFATNLSPGKHTLMLRMSGNKNEKSTGTAARILKFMAN